MNTHTAGAQTQEKSFSQLTKKERRNVRLERHYESLQRLYDLCGGGSLTGKKLSSKLLGHEKNAAKYAVQYCNGDIGMNQWEMVCFDTTEAIQKFFNGNLKGFFVNGDPRGYTLKIQDKTMREDYSQTNLHKDWGGYGILAPEINGDY